MKYILTFCFVVIALSTYHAQTEINKSISLDGQQEFSFYIEYGHADVSTWDKDYISIIGLVDIDQGKYNDLLTIEYQEDTDKISVSVNMDEQKLNKKKFSFNNDICIKDGDQSEFEDHPVTKYNKHILDIYFKVQVPNNMELNMVALYGNLKLQNPTERTTMQNTFGGVEAIVSNQLSKRLDLDSGFKYVDLTLKEDIKSDIKLTTNTGTVFTDFDIETRSNIIPNKFHVGKEESVKAELNGGGPKINITSSFGNIYLRKAR